MANTIETAGYVISDNEGIIHVIGTSLDAAWSDLEETFRYAQIVLLDDDDDGAEQQGAWCRRSNLRAHPATAELLREVQDMGGNLPCGWSKLHGVACTPEQADL
jgi:hypothetical protein